MKFHQKKSKEKTKKKIIYKNKIINNHNKKFKVFYFNKEL